MAKLAPVFLAPLLFAIVLRAQDPTPLDEAHVVSVTPGPGLLLRDREKVPFEVTLHYSLKSSDTAVIYAYAEGYPASSRPCDRAGVHLTEGLNHALIKRGEGDVTIRFEWFANPQQIGFETARVGFGINIWPQRGGMAVKPMKKAIVPTFCRPVEPKKP